MREQNTNVSGIQFKSEENPSIITWSSSGKGVMGESANDSSPTEFRINRNWVPQKNSTQGD
jgi:hypothetical protein